MARRREKTDCIFFCLYIIHRPVILSSIFSVYSSVLVIPRIKIQFVFIITIYVVKRLVDFNWILILGIFRISVNPFADRLNVFYFGIEWNKYLIDIVKPLFYIFVLTSIIDGTHVIFGIGTISSSPTTT
jgi:hypothetical protein